MRRGKSVTEESFLKDIATHELTVRHDDGIYRHLRLAQPKSSNMWFDIVTWPGFLAYAGDMGSFTFSRLPDMFEFFRSKPTGPLDINLQYWGEKLEAVDQCGYESGYKVYSAELLRENVEDHIKTWLEDFDSEDAAIGQRLARVLRAEVEEDIYRYMDDSEHEAREAVRDFSFEYEGNTYEFSDSWEWNCRDYTLRFVWCCYAIAWAIRQYDEAEQTVEAA